MNLTPSEKEFFKCLEQANTNTILGAGIEIVIKNPSEENVRQIIQELREQVFDNSRGVKEVLGEKCFEQLMSL